MSVKLSVAYAGCQALTLYAKCRYADCRYAECRYAECRYAECLHADCRDAKKNNDCKLLS